MEFLVSPTAAPVSCPAHNGSVPAPAQMEGFKTVSPGMLIEKGDECLDAHGQFQPCALEMIGQQVHTSGVVRRLEGRTI